MGGMTFATIFLVFAIYFFANRMVCVKDFNKLRVKKSASKNRKKKVMIKKKRLKVQKEKYSKLFIALIIASTLTFSSTGYFYYYTLVNLSSTDKKLVVEGYYLLRDLEKQLDTALKKNEDQVPTKENIKHLSNNLASFGTSKANVMNSQQGQAVLNRYYKSLCQLGVNAGLQTNNFYESPELIEEFMSDLQKVIKKEKQIFNYYKVDESKMKQE